MKREDGAAAVHYDSIMAPRFPRLNGKAIKFTGGNMTYCSECNSVEQGTVTKVVDGEKIEVCAACQSEDDTMTFIDEDAGKDR